MTARSPSAANGSDASRRVAFVSLGCPKNLVDSDQMLGTLRSSGFTLVNEQDGADAVIINTCGFLEASKQESIDVINDAVARKNRGELKRVIVAGCLVQRHRAKLLEWAPGIDAMIGVFDRDHIVDAVAGPPASRGDTGATTLRVVSPEVELDIEPNGITTARRAVAPNYWIAANALAAAKERGIDTTGLTVNGADGKGVGYFESDSNRFRITPRHWAYLRVSEGCNQKCAFCTIPSIRGKMRSKPLDRILDEARALMNDGAFELNLIGQDTTSYGYDIYGKDASSTVAAVSRAGLPHGISGDLVGLLTGLNDVAAEFGGGWMRLMYVYPSYFTDEMIDAIASLPNIVKYIDIPLQHMSDHMLAAMRRNITRDQQAELLHKLRERIPGVAIRTTFITGFPGETDEDHAQLLAFIEEFQFDMMGVFQFSREDGTPAGTMDLDPALHVPSDIKAAREAELMLAQQRIAFDNAAFVAESRVQFDVMIEGRADSTKHEQFAELGQNRIAGAPAATLSRRASDATTYLGRCYHQAPQVDSATYVVSAAELSPGQRIRCTIIDSDGYDLIARPTHEAQRIMSLPVAGRH